MIFKELKSRSFIKTLSWFIVGFSITLVAFSLITGDIKEGFQGSIVVQSIKLFAYYWHERVWSRLKYGRKFNPSLK